MPARLSHTGENRVERPAVKVCNGRYISVQQIDSPEPSDRIRPGAKGLTRMPTAATRGSSVLGRVETTCVSADCAPLPAEVPVAWATAPLWFAAPAGLWSRAATERSHRSGGRRGARIPVHRRGVLRPHFAVQGFGDRDRRGVLAQHVCRDQRGQLSAVRRDHRRWDRHRERSFKGCRCRLCLAGGLLGLRGSCTHPRGILSGCRRHRR